MAKNAETIATAYLQIVPKVDTNTLTQAVTTGATSAASKASSAVTSIGTLANSKLTKSMSRAFDVVAAAGVAAVGGITAATLSAYSEYEQLIGGVETLYGDAAETVEKNAASAYSRMGMSANEYMTSATSYAAVLRQALGGDVVAAAEKSDKALLEIADNANKMGTDVSSVTDAFNGFAKQNYTMLDNLKLGYGGTKSEMERLLADAEELTGIHYDIENFADIVDAIGAIQDELGITGTTAAEAADTIQGSVAAASAAWTNWLVGLADENADMSALTNNLADAVGNVAKNVGPRLIQAADAIGAALPALVEALAPYIIQAAGIIVKALFSALGSLIASYPVAGVALGFLAFFKALSIGAAVVEMVSAFATIGTAVASAASAIAGLGGGLSAVVAALTGPLGIVLAIAAAVAALVWFFTQTETGRALVASFAAFVTTTAAQIVATLQAVAFAISSTINAIAVSVSTAVATVSALISAAAAAISATVSSVSAAISSAMSAAAAGVSAAVAAMRGAASSAFGAIAATAASAFGGIASAASSAMSSARAVVSSGLSAIRGFFSGLRLSLPHISLPHFSISGGFSIVPPRVPSISVSWYSSGAVFDVPSLIGVGDATTPEIITPQAMMEQTFESVLLDFAGNAAGAVVGDITIPVYVGTDRLAVAVLKAQQRANYRSGGRA